MRPLPCFLICGTTAFEASHTPRTFTAISWSHSAAGISQKGRIASVENIAALFTRMSMRPNLSSAAAASALQLASSDDVGAHELALHLVARPTGPCRR